MQSEASEVLVRNWDFILVVWGVTGDFEYSKTVADLVLKDHTGSGHPSGGQLAFGEGREITLSCEGPS